MRVAVIGAGIAGLSAARMLAAGGVDVQVFDKARGPGGRTTSKRTSLGSVDLGAQYFTANSRLFRETVARWCRDGVVSTWDVVPGVFPRRERGHPRRPERYVATPRMSSLGRYLADGLELYPQTRIVHAGIEGGRGRIGTDDGGVISGFDRLIVAVPAPQALALIDTSEVALIAALESVRFDPCWAAAFGAGDDAPGQVTAAFVNEGPVGWLACNSAKPARVATQSLWTVHATPAWSRDHLDDAPDAVAAALWRAAREWMPQLPMKPSLAKAHRWRYARAAAPLERGYLVNTGGRVGVCGDWAADGRVEGAWLSGRALARHFLET